MGRGKGKVLTVHQDNIQTSPHMEKKIRLLGISKFVTGLERSSFYIYFFNNKHCFRNDIKSVRF